MTTALPPIVIEYLTGQGCTATWAGERMGLGKHQAAKLLRAAGATNTSGRWMLPGYARPRLDPGRACVASVRSGVAFGSARDAC
jgi:hypothetical protein